MQEEHLENVVHSPREFFHTYLRTLDPERGGLTDNFRTKLARVLAHYGVTSFDRGRELDDAVFRIFLAQQRSTPDVTLASALLQRWTTEPRPTPPQDATAREVLDRLVLAAQLRFPLVGDLARSVRFRWFDQPLVDADRTAVLADVAAEVDDLAAHPDAADRAERIEQLAAIPEQIVRFLAARLDDELPEQEPMLEVLVRRHYREYDLTDVRSLGLDGRPFVVADYTLDDRPTHLVSTIGRVSELTPDSALATAVDAQLAQAREGQQAVVDLYLRWPELPADQQEAADALRGHLETVGFTRRVRRVALAVSRGGDRATDTAYFTFRPDPQGPGLFEDDLVRGVHPMVGRRLALWRLRSFDLTRVDAPEDVLLLHAVAKDNPSDQRLVALAQVRQFGVVRDESGAITALPHVERAIAGCLEAIRRARAARGAAGARLDMNHVWLHVWPVIDAEVEQITALQDKIAPLTAGAGIEEILAEGRVVGPDGTPVPISARFSYRPGSGVTSRIDAPSTELLKPVDDYQQKVLRARRRGLVYPYELQNMITGEGGSAQELDLDDTGRLVPVDRAPGLNKAGIIAGLVTSPTRLHPEGVDRVLLAGDPTKALGAVAEPECARIIAALDLAQERGIPVEWYALSAGARISMDSGVENMDWVARRAAPDHRVHPGGRRDQHRRRGDQRRRPAVLERRGDDAHAHQGHPRHDARLARWSSPASSRWTSPAASPPRTTSASAATTASWAPTARRSTGRRTSPVRLHCSSQHYDHATSRRVDRSRAGRDRATLSTATCRRTRTSSRAATSPAWATSSARRPTPTARSPSTSAPSCGPSPTRTTRCSSAGPAWPTPRPPSSPTCTSAGSRSRSSGSSPGRCRDAASRPRTAPTPTRPGRSSPARARRWPGPSTPRAETGPSSSWPTCPASTARRSRCAPAAGVRRRDRPVHRQLRRADRLRRRLALPRRRVRRVLQGAQRAMTVLAVDGSFASVLGGAPAAAVVFSADVDARTAADPRVTAAERALAEAGAQDRAALQVALTDTRTSVRAEKLGEVASEFDGIHSIRRAVRVGSVDKVIQASDLRPEIVAALEASLG